MDQLPPSVNILLQTAVVRLLIWTKADLRNVQLPRLPSLFEQPAFYWKCFRGGAFVWGTGGDHYILAGRVTEKRCDNVRM